MKDLIHMEKPYILLIHETKLEEGNFLRSSKFFWNKGQGITNSSRGELGGVGTLWNETLFKLVLHRKETHWIFMQLKHKAS